MSRWYPLGNFCGSRHHTHSELVMKIKVDIFTRGNWIIEPDNELIFRAVYVYTSGIYICKFRVSFRERLLAVKWRNWSSDGSVGTAMGN